EAALLAAVAGGLPVPDDADALDAPRPLPEPLQARLESALMAEAAGVVIPLDGRRRHRKVLAAWSAVAAVLLLVVAMAGLLGRGGPGSHRIEAAGGPTSTTVTAPASLPSDTGAVTSESAPPAT